MHNLPKGECGVDMRRADADNHFVEISSDASFEGVEPRCRS